MSIARCQMLHDLNLNDYEAHSAANRHQLREHSPRSARQMVGKPCIEIKTAPDKQPKHEYK
jgi:hypothetical protein